MRQMEIEAHHHLDINKIKKVDMVEEKEIMVVVEDLSLIIKIDFHIEEILDIVQEDHHL